MRALLYHGPGDLRVEEVPRPEPGRATSSSRSRSRSPTGRTPRRSGAAIRSCSAETPSPFGHEFCGIDVATGRRVVAANSAPCGACAPCRRGEETLCENLPPFLNGAYAEYLLVPARIAERNLLPVPPGLAPEVAAMVEPLACCLPRDRAGGDRGGPDRGRRSARGRSGSCSARPPRTPART